MRKLVIISSRKGLTHHIEMMISFTLFIFFVFFVMFFVKPQDNSFLGGSVVSGAYHNLLINTEIDVVKFFVEIEIISTLGEECIQLDLPDELIDGIYNSSISVQSFQDTQRETGLINNVDSAVLGIKHGSLNTSYYILLSNEFSDEDLSGCTFYPPASFEYSFGGFKRDQVISFLRLKQIESEYKNDYDSLRTKLGIPETFDYAVLAPGTSMNLPVPSGVNVLARDYIEKVIYEDGSIKFERITIKLWR